MLGLEIRLVRIFGLKCHSLRYCVNVRGVGSIEGLGGGGGPARALLDKKGLLKISSKVMTLVNIFKVRELTL